MGRSQYGYASKIRAILGLKEGRQADAIVVVVDRDGKKNKDKIGELNKGREELRCGEEGCLRGEPCNRNDRSVAAGRRKGIAAGAW